MGWVIDIWHDPIVRLLVMLAIACLTVKVACDFGPQD
tara:strand:- start:637 stop:747 length:111 start_codon:yes stop_codon:yes gene_type:complete